MPEAADVRASHPGPWNAWTAVSWLAAAAGAAEAVMLVLSWKGYGVGSSFFVRYAAPFALFFFASGLLSGLKAWRLTPRPDRQAWVLAGAVVSGLGLLAAALVLLAALFVVQSFE